MPDIASIDTSDCLFDCGLVEACKHKLIESQRFGEDLGMLSVKDWCSRHWRTFQRFRRIEHVFGEKYYRQFPAVEFGVWKDREREEGSVFDLVLGAFECCMENLQFVEWARSQKLSEKDAYPLFILLDPNCVRWDPRHIIQRAERLVLS